MMNLVCSRKTHFLLVASILWAGAACSPSAEREAAPPLDSLQIGDTLVLRTVRPSEVDTARLTFLSRIGRMDGPEEFLISGWVHFTVGWRGEIYVADDAGVRVFSRDGKTVRQIARRGQGPGEVRNVEALAVDDLGRLLVVDHTNRRVAVFDTSGSVVDHWRLPYGRPGKGQPSIRPVPNGETLLLLNPPLNPNGEPMGLPRPIFQRVNHDGVVLDSVWAPERYSVGCPYPDDPHFSAGLWQDRRELVFPKVKWTATREGEIVIGCPAQYWIDRIQPGGSVTRVSHARAPLMASGEERSSFVQGTEETQRRLIPGWNWTGPEPPVEIPYFQKVLVTRDGRLWVWPGRHRERVVVNGNEGWVEPRTGGFDVFDTTGAFLGVAPLPDGAEYRWYSGFDDPFIAGDTIWLVRRDSLGVPYVDRWFVEWPT